jgi:hypothetical protein
VPVLVSKNVGAKDIVSIYNPEFIFNPSEDELQTQIENILTNEMLLENYNKKIYYGNFEYFLKHHVQEIKQLYTTLLEKQ